MTPVPAARGVVSALLVGDALHRVQQRQPSPGGPEDRGHNVGP